MQRQMDLVKLLHARAVRHLTLVSQSYEALQNAIMGWMSYGSVEP